MAIDIFGQSANINEILKIAKKYNLEVISDSAQAMDQSTIINFQEHLLI